MTKEADTNDKIPADPPPEKPLLDFFPGLNAPDYGRSEMKDFNCFAWAAGETHRWWEPDEKGRFFWPEEAPREYSLAAYVKAYETLGYVSCESALHEKDFEKIAIYVDSRGTPKHAARQLPSGRWSSKRGRDRYDTHTLLEISGSECGRVAMIMKRPVRPDGS